MKKDYKVGDEVLVRVRLGEQKENRAALYGSTSASGFWFDTQDIYGPAPEFNPGDEIEVSDNEVYWVKRRVAAVIPGDKSPYKVWDFNGVNIFGYQFARKPQPKTEITLHKEPADEVIVNGVVYRKVEG